MARILVADHDFSFRSMIEVPLTFHGVEVNWAAKPREAFQLVLEPEPIAAAVIGDFEGGMHETLTLVTDIRSMFSKAEVPILVVSANAYALDRHNALTAGANDFLPKPFDNIDHLVSRVTSYLRAA